MIFINHTVFMINALLFLVISLITDHQQSWHFWPKNEKNQEKAPVSPPAPPRGMFRQKPLFSSISLAR